MLLLLLFFSDFCLEVAKETLHELRAAKRKQEQHKLNTERKVLIISEQVIVSCIFAKLRVIKHLSPSKDWMRLDG